MTRSSEFERAPGAPVRIVSADALPTVPHQSTRADSFDALFVPASALVPPVPFSFHLLELVRPLLTPDRGAHHAQYELRYPNGVLVRVALHGHGQLGLPTVFDLDPLLSIFRQASERGVDDTGTLRGITFRDIARTMGIPAAQYGGKLHAQIKDALNRWAALKIETDFDFGPGRRGQEPRDVRARVNGPDSLPHRVRRRKEWYGILQHGIVELEPTGVESLEDDRARTDTRELLGAVRIDRVWLEDVARGFTAAVDLELHAGLSERYAKRLYEVLLVRALRHGMWGPHEPWRVSISELLGELGVEAIRKRTRDTVVAKLPLLVDRGVLASFRMHPGRGDRLEVELVPGERLTAARTYAGVRMLERPEVARLVWALQQTPWSFSLPEARYAVERRPDVVLRVLQRAVYQLETKWEPENSWSGWVRHAIDNEYTFSHDPRYLAWLEARFRGHKAEPSLDVRRMPVTVANRLLEAAGRSAIAIVPEQLSLEAVAPTATEPKAPELFEDTVWGRVRKQLRDEMEAVPYECWVASLRAVRLPGAGERVLELSAPDEFAAEWVNRGLIDRIRELTLTEVGGAVQTIVRAIPSDVQRRANSTRG